MARFLQKIFIFFLIIKSYNATYNPGPRSMHSASLTDDKIYIVGGFSNSAFLNDTFYLDLSSNFLLDNAPFTSDETTPELGTVFGNMADAVGGDDNDVIFLFGGWQGILKSQFDGVMALDTSDKGDIKGWSELITKGPLPHTRDSWKAVSDNKGLIYLYGGCYRDLYSNCTINNTTMFIFNTKVYSWSTNVQPNPPHFETYYSATLLSDGKIVYIGGANFDINSSVNHGYNLVNINNITIYDTSSGTWSYQISNNSVIQDRLGHSAILAPDGYSIIVYGGTTDRYNPVDAANALWSLDTRRFTWSQPQIADNKYGPSGVLFHHTATLYQGHMIILFGAKANFTASSNVYMLNVNNANAFTWVNSFTPSSNSSSSSYKLAIAFPILLALILVGALSYIYYQNRKKQQKKAQPKRESSTLQVSSYGRYSWFY